MKASKLYALLLLAGAGMLLTPADTYAKISLSAQQFPQAQLTQATPLNATPQEGLDTLSLESIFYEPLLAGNRPDFTSFSPDLSHIYFQANDSSLTEEKTYRVSLRGEDSSPVDDEVQQRFTVSPDRNKLTYSDGGDIWIADTDFSNKQKLVDAKSPVYNATWSPDSRRIAFVQQDNVWILDLETSGLQQITETEEDEPGFNIADWPGGNKLVLQQYDTSDFEEYYFPEYVNQYVNPGTTRRGVATQYISVADLDSNKVNKLYEQKGYTDVSVSASGEYVALDLIDPPMKNRKIKTFALNGDTTGTIVFEGSTDGWIYGADMDFAPEGEKLMLRSEADGWNHIYTVDPDGKNLQQHTTGNFDIPWAEWTGGGQIVYASNEVDPGERHLYSLDINGGEVTRLTGETGYRQGFELSRDKRHVVYEYTYFNEPFELHSLDLENPDREVRLTETVPERFHTIDWQEEDYIRFTGRDGETELSMSVLEPHDMQPGEEYPVVVFVHGAGSLQNVYKGWSNSYYREYMFHQYLNARDYYVIEVDYRHSTGYGREFREDVTNWMGKYETHDIVDGLEHLAANYGQADTSNVGIYGGSYGGFMALYATSVEPDYFDAAAALRAVTNWENYYHTNPWYTLPRLGKPDVDSTHYEQSSPISYVDQLEKPVLILHGLIDNNVGFQDAAQYVEELIQAGDKDFDMMMYPSERHSFQDPDAWYDEYNRIFNFFEEQLK